MHVDFGQGGLNSRTMSQTNPRFFALNFADCFPYSHGNGVIVGVEFRLQESLAECFQFFFLTKDSNFVHKFKQRRSIGNIQ